MRKLKGINRYLPVLVALVLMATFAMTACTQSPAEEQEPAAQEPAAEEPAAEEPAAEEPAAEEPAAEADPLRAYEGTTLRVLLKVGYETAAIEEYVSEFEEATGINVEYEVFDEPTMREKFILDATAEAGDWDVLTVQFWYFPEYDRAGWLEPLDPYIANNPNPWLSVQDIPEGLLQTYTGTDGQLYVIPVSMSGGVMMYRTDILEELGLEPPQTTDDVMDVAEAAAEAGIDAVPFVGRGDSTFASFGTTAGWAWAYGARVLDENGNVTVNTPEMQTAMEDLVTLMRDYGPEGQAAIGWSEMSELYRNGGAVMNFDMSGFPSVYGNPEISDVADSVDFTLVEGPAGNAIQWLYGEGLGINKYSENKEAAWLFLTWRTSQQIQMREVEDGIRFDVVSSEVLTSPEYQAQAESAGIQWFTDRLPAILDSIDPAYWPAVPEFVEVAEAFQQEISLAISGEQTVEEALEKAQAAVEDVLQ